MMQPERANSRENPWDHWLRTLHEEALLASSGLIDARDRRRLRQRLDIECEAYQKRYAREYRARKDTQPYKFFPASDLVNLAPPSVDIIYGGSHATQDYLDTLNHPMDTGTDSSNPDAIDGDLTP